MRSPAFAAALWIASFALGAEAGEEPAVTFEWSAPAECPAESAVLDEVRQIVGPAAHVAEPVRAKTVVGRTSDGWHADVELAASGDANHRTVRGDSCREVAGAVALIVALAVNPEATLPPSASPLPASSTSSSRSRESRRSHCGSAPSFSPAASCG